MEKEINKKLDSLYPLITDTDLEKYAKLFRQDLIMALSNQKSSLPSILNPVARITPSPGFGVAIAIGGTNGYVSSFRISSNKVVKFFNRQAFSLPERTTKEALFHLITQNVFAVTKGRKKPFTIGIGFAYPLRPLLYHQFIDGELLYMAKGRDIHGLVGKRVGQEYHKFLEAEYGIDTSVIVANDSICLLLGGNGADLAGIVGTGLNFAYWEKRSHIAPLKLSELAGYGQGEVAINIESKNFDKIEGTPLRNIVDKESDDPGYSLAEKEAAGAYLYKIFNTGKMEIIGKEFPDLVASDQLNEIVTSAFSYPDAITKDQREAAKLFAERIFRRSAQIVAIQLCGVLLKLGRKDGLVPIVMEGGIFWKAKNYPSLVNEYVNLILPEVIPSFARLFGSSRRGMAILAQSAPQL